jgi:cytochrome c-type biogenesis protein CcmH
VSAAVTSRRVGRLGSFGLWVVALVAVVALVIVSTPSTPSAAARAAHLETLVKCPSCQDLSVAQSNSSSSLAVRHQIETMVARGESDSQVLTTIETAYGPSILLSPSTGGLGVVLWILPTAVFVGLGAMVVVVRRRR